jgi:hypothetical protein
LRHHLNLMSADGGRVSIHLDQTGPPDAVPPALSADLVDATVAVIDLTDSSPPVLTGARRAGAIGDAGADQAGRPRARAALLGDPRRTSSQAGTLVGWVNTAQRGARYA